MGVVQKPTFTTPESLKKNFGVSLDLMEYNERGKPLKRLSSLTNPKSWLQKMLMCSEPELEMSQCAAQIWGLGRSPKRGPGADALVGG